MTQTSIQDLNRMIWEANDVIRPEVPVTPMLIIPNISSDCELDVALKVEAFGVTGAFKARGAQFAVETLTDDELANGVVASSSGNHGKALANAAASRNTPAYIVVPNNAPAVKIAAIKKMGGEVFLCEPSDAARKAECERIQKEKGSVLIPSSNHIKIIAGQGTIGIEILDQLENCGTIVVQIGGGGLASGIAIAAKQLKPSIKVIGIEPENADDLARSLAKGEIIPSDTYPETIADGLKVGISPIPFEILKEVLDDVITVSERQIANAMMYLLRHEIEVEPSGAVSFAAVLANKIPNDRSGSTVAILSGSNFDKSRYPEIISLCDPKYTDGWLT